MLSVVCQISILGNTIILRRSMIRWSEPSAFIFIEEACCVVDVERRARVFVVASLRFVRHSRS